MVILSLFNTGILVTNMVVPTQTAPPRLA